MTNKTFEDWAKQQGYTIPHQLKDLRSAFEAGQKALRQELYDKINEFDDAYWVQNHANVSERSRQVQTISGDVLQMLVEDYWCLMNEVMNDI